MKFENLAIIAGAVAVAYVFIKAKGVEKAMSSLAGYSDTQYGSGWVEPVKQTSGGLLYA